MNLASKVPVTPMLSASEEETIVSDAAIAGVEYRIGPFFYLSPTYLERRKVKLQESRALDSADTVKLAIGIAVATVTERGIDKSRNGIFVLNEDRGLKVITDHFRAPTMSEEPSPEQCEEFHRILRLKPEELRRFLRFHESYRINSF